MEDIKQQLEREVFAGSRGKKLSSVELAYSIASFAHKGQKRRNGEPYLSHPLRIFRTYQELTGIQNQDDVAADLETFGIPFYGVQELCLLHDVVEDTPITIEDIEGIFERNGMGSFFRAYIKNSLILITHKKEEDYNTYIGKLAQDPRASLVKMMDLQDNSALFGLEKVTPRDLERTRGYLNYFAILDSAHGFLTRLKEFRRRSLI